MINKTKYENELGNYNTKKEIFIEIIYRTMQVGEYIKKNALNIQTLEWKGSDDPVTNLDKEAEKMIIEKLSQNIHANYYGEEFGIQNNSARINIYTDPIDGTKSFIRGEYLSSLSVAADLDGKLFAGVVCDFMKDITYYATEEGSYVQSTFQKRKIPINLEFSKPTISFSWNYEQNKDAKNPIFARKQAASIALSMAQLAYGSYDGLIAKPHTKNGVTDTCDIAAGYYIMKQAGIKIIDYYGNEFDYRNPSQGIIAYKNTPKMEETVNEIMKEMRNQ